jgi:hypothetical protein
LLTAVDDDDSDISPHTANEPKRRERTRAVTQETKPKPKQRELQFWPDTGLIIDAQTQKRPLRWWCGGGLVERGNCRKKREKERVTQDGSQDHITADARKKEGVEMPQKNSDCLS